MIDYELKVPGSRRARMERIATQIRLDQAAAANKGRPLSFEQLRAIGITPKGTRSSTGVTPQPQAVRAPSTVLYKVEQRELRRLLRLARPPREPVVWVPRPTHQGRFGLGMPL